MLVVLALHVDGFAYDATLGEIGYDATYQLGRQLQRMADLFGGRCRLLGAETAVDRGGDEHGEEVVVLARDVLHVFLEIEVLHILRGVRQLGAIEADDPCHLNPEQEQRQGCKRTIDGVIFADPDLAGDEETLEQHEGRTCDGGSHQGVDKAYLGVGDDYIYKGKSHDGQAVRGPSENADQGLAELIIVKVGLDVGLQEDLRTRGDDQEEWHEEHDAQIVGDAAEGGSALFLLPDLIEDRLDIAYQAIDDVDEHDDTNAHDQTGLGVLEIVGRKGDDVVRDFFLSRHEAVQRPRDIALEAEPIGYADDQRHHGDDGQQCVVGEGRGLLDDTVGDEETDAEKQRLKDIHQPTINATHIVVGVTPDVVSQESPGPLNDLDRIILAAVSRHLFQGDAATADEVAISEDLSTIGAWVDVLYALIVDGDRGFLATIFDGLLGREVDVGILVLELAA